MTAQPKKLLDRPEPAWERAYIYGLKKKGERGLAADFAGVSRSTTWRHEQGYPAFKERVLAALDEYMKTDGESRFRRVEKIF